jgi:pyruvate dehydrogenase (quinone)
MKKTVSDQLLQRLHDWGVRRVFGYPGDGINGLMGAFDRMDDRMSFVQARHEELAAFMACAHAKFTGEVGVCMATSGPGAIHLLNGLYDAKADHTPVLAIVGQTARAAMGGDYQQEVDLHSLFKDVAHEYVQTAMVPPRTAGPLPASSCRTIYRKRPRWRPRRASTARCIRASGTPASAWCPATPTCAPRPTC